MNKNKIVSALVSATIIFNFVLPSLADQSEDMWNGWARGRNLSEPHENYCDSGTEAFVQIGSSTDGYCIEKAERSAEEWEEARQVCASENKRLPEFAEWKYACTRAGALSLSNMTGNWEWAANVSAMYYYGSGDQGEQATIVGYSYCTNAAISDIGSIGASSVVSHAFRCVR